MTLAMRLSGPRPLRPLAARLRATSCASHRKRELLASTASYCWFLAAQASEAATVLEAPVLSKSFATNASGFSIRYPEYWTIAFVRSILQFRLCDNMEDVHDPQTERQRPNRWRRPAASVQSFCSTFLSTNEEPRRLQDRTLMKVPGSLLVVGDFNNAVTMNVSRAKLSEFGVPNLKPADLEAPEAQERFISAILDQLALQTGLFSLQVVQSVCRKGQDGRWYVDLEFENSVCRGDIVEGAGGRRRCALLPWNAVLALRCWPTCTLQFENSVCRGDVVEGAGGRRRCALAASTWTCSGLLVKLHSAVSYLC